MKPIRNHTMCWRESIAAPETRNSHGESYKPFRAFKAKSLRVNRSDREGKAQPGSWIGPDTERHSGRCCPTVAGGSVNSNDHSAKFHAHRLRCLRRVGVPGPAGVRS